MPRTDSDIPLVRNVFFRRSKNCPLSGENAPDIDYKNIELLRKFITPDRGRIVPSRITSVSKKKQRKLSQAIKRARVLGLLPFVAKDKK